MDVAKMIRQCPGATFADRLLSDLTLMEEQLAALCPGAGELSEGLGRLIGAGGKRLRPMLAWVSWHMAGERGEILPLMRMLELMHTSSLIHDDFVDGALLRRGVPTINAESGGLAALRGGDYLLSRAMDELKVYRGTGINEALTDVAEEMCLGELDQRAGLYRVRGLDMERCFSRIRRKTALLMAESCRCGAVAGGGNKDLCRAMNSYGEHLGLAFQLRDDLNDLTDRESGKAPLQDLRSGVITVPLLLAVRELGEELIPLLEKEEKTAEDAEYIKARTISCGALEKTAAMIKNETDTAAQALSGLKNSAGKKALTLLAKSISEVETLG